VLVVAPVRSKMRAVSMSPTCGAPNTSTYFACACFSDRLVVQELVGQEVPMLAPSCILEWVLMRCTWIPTIIMIMKEVSCAVSGVLGGGGG
jgi:hypothetical protein